MNRARFERRPAPFERRAALREQRRKIILACEGTKTEPGYFTELVREERIDIAVNVIIAPHRGTAPVSVVEAAIEERQKLKHNKRWQPRDEVWAIYDGEEHRAANAENWHRAIDMAHGNNVNLAVSNPCFELWFLLHFEDCYAAVDRVEVRRRLKKHIAEYDKSLPVYTSYLRGHTDAAIARAKQIAAFAQQGDKPPHDNPCTGIGPLVALLLGLPY